MSIIGRILLHLALALAKARVWLVRTAAPSSIHLLGSYHTSAPRTACNARVARVTLVSAAPAYVTCQACREQIAFDDGMRANDYETAPAGAGCQP